MPLLLCRAHKPPPVSFSSACRSRSASSCSHHLLLFPASLSAFWPCLVVCLSPRCNKRFSFTCHPGARSAKQVRGQRPGDGSAPRYLTLLPCKKVLLRTALERSALARAAAITIADHQTTRSRPLFRPDETLIISFTTARQRCASCSLARCWLGGAGLAGLAVGCWLGGLGGAGLAGLAVLAQDLRAIPAAGPDGSRVHGPDGELRVRHNALSRSRPCAPLGPCP